MTEEKLEEIEARVRSASWSDSDFITSLKRDVPWLIDEVKRLQQWQLWAASKYPELARWYAVGIAVQWSADGKSFKLVPES